jgi:hypothetical protein
VWDDNMSTSFFLHLMGDKDAVHYNNDDEDDNEDEDKDKDNKEEEEEEDDDNDARINCWQKLGRRI